MIKRGKKGTIKMCGDKDTIFTDVVRIVDAYCLSHTEIIEGADETKLIAAIILAVATEGDSNINFKALRKILKNVEVEK